MKNKNDVEKLFSKKLLLGKKENNLHYVKKYCQISIKIMCYLLFVM
jgi:hypothetical protein